RDFHVTGVQTCALPIYVVPWPGVLAVGDVARTPRGALLQRRGWAARLDHDDPRVPLLRQLLRDHRGSDAGADDQDIALDDHAREIGRASCRERGVVSEG